MIGKLVKKSLVIKIQVSSNINEVALVLTEKGMLVHQRHQERHSEIHNEISKLLTNCSTEQLSFLTNIQEIIEKFLDKKSQE
jgi:hypothetical protein